MIATYEWCTAVHEAGHVLGAQLARIPGTHTPLKIKTATIVPRGDTDGHVAYGDIMLWNDSILFSLLGHAAVLEFTGWDGGKRDGHYKDYEKAIATIKNHIRIKRLGEDAFKRDYHFSLNSEWRAHQKKKRVSKKECKPLLDHFRRKARRLARMHRGYIEQVAHLLIAKRTLTDADIPPLVRE